MNSRKHIYFITVSDLQTVARENIGRNLNSAELTKIIDRVLDSINWYDPVEEAIFAETETSEQAEEPMSRR